MADEVYKQQEHVDFTFVDNLTESLSGREDQSRVRSDRDEARRGSLLGWIARSNRSTCGYAEIWLQGR